MAEVTVRQLADVVGVSVDRLLKQMKQAGLAHTEAQQSVSDKDKQTLLLFLKGSHGKSVTSSQKITLKRKKLTTLKSSSNQGKKTINVEVRKKRTYVKREPTTDVTTADQPQPITSEPIEPTTNTQDVSVPPAESYAEKPTVVEQLDKSQLDPEALRQAAAVRRKKEEEEAKQAAAAKAAEKVSKEEITAEKSKKTSKPQAAVDKLPTATTPDTTDEKKKKSKPLGVKTRGKGRGRNIKNIDLLVDSEQDQTKKAYESKVLKLPKSAKIHGFSIPTDEIVREIRLPESIAVSDLAQQMAVKVRLVIKKLAQLDITAAADTAIDQETAQLVVEELGHKAILVTSDQLEQTLKHTIAARQGTQEPRAPVITVMGHVDHGKTSLLDTIREAKVTSTEAGGITQHIGAYHVNTDNGMITFIDTPGHAAFTAMRARGAQSTDIIILVVAADDGVMPQTEEAIQHARAAQVPIVVAVNKIDKEDADPNRVRNELAAKDVIPEDWGGDVQFVNVSAHSGEGIDNLLDAVLLQAELMELTAAKDTPASGLVLESRLDKSSGPVVSILVQTGTLHQGDIILAGHFYGRVRVMRDENAQPLKTAGPSIPVEILGLNGTPDAGDPFIVLDNEKQARETAAARIVKERESKLQQQQATKLDDLFANLGAADTKLLNVAIKADARGSLEAIQAALQEIGTEEVGVNIVVSGVGGISETDVSLAIATDAVIFGFNVRADSAAQKLVKKAGLDLRYYSVIYDLVDDVKQALSGMLSPELREEINGIAEVRDVFSSPKLGAIAGCMVIEGTIFRNNPIRVLRDDVVIYEGELESLRRFKEDVNEVRSGFECGIGVKNYNDVKPGDKIEVYEVKKIARSL